MNYRICRLQHELLRIRSASQLCSSRSTHEPRRVEAAEDCSSGLVLTSMEVDEGRQAGDSDMDKAVGEPQRQQ